MIRLFTHGTVPAGHIRRPLRIGAGVTLVLLSAAVPANAQAPHGSRWGQFWGTYSHQLQMAPGQNIANLVTLHVDGTTAVTTSVMFGGFPNSLQLYSSINGVWERIGWRSVRGTGIWYFFNAASGVLTGIGRYRTSADFSEDFNSYKGTEFWETVLCPTPLTCPDPADPRTKWTPDPNMPAAGYTMSGTRIELAAAGPLKN